MPAFYALKDTKTPVMVALIAFIVNLGFSLLLMGPLKHGGLALASSISALGNMALLIYFLRKKIGPFGGKDIFQSAGKGLLASLPMSFAVYWAMTLIDWSQYGHNLVKTFVLGGAVSVGIFIYFISAHLLRCQEAQQAATLLRRKLLRK